MSLFKKVMDATDIFPTVKKAALEVSLENEEAWKKDIDEYVNNKYQELSSGLRGVNFKRTKEESGDAVGEIVYNSGGVNFIIPIILEDFKLKEPDVGIMGNKVIPVDSGFIEWISSRNSQSGEIVDTEDDLTTDMSFLQSIFDDTVINNEGAPVGQSIKAAALNSTMDNISKFISELPSEVPNIKKIADIVKSATSKYPTNDSPLDIILEEDIDNPYHYFGAILEKDASGNLFVKEGYYSHQDVDDLGVLTRNESDIIDPKGCDINKLAAEIPIVGKISESGRHDQVVGFDYDLGYICINVVSGLFPLFGEIDQSKSLAVGEERRAQVDGRFIEEERCSWMFGDLYGSKPEDVGEVLVKTDLLHQTEKYTSKDFILGRSIYFELGDKITPPYKVLNEERSKDMSINTNRLLIDVEDFKGKRVRLWIMPDLTSVVKANKNKMRKNGFSTVAEFNGDIYLVPASYNIKILPETHLAAKDPKVAYKEIIRKVANEFDGTFSVSDLKDGTYSIMVDEVEHSNMSKEAALLYSRYYINSGVEDLSDIDLDGEYNYKIAKDVDRWGVLDPYRGEWIKAAYLISKKSNEKLAEVESVVNDLVGIEFLDNSNIGSIEEVLSLLLNTLDRIGQLLILSRASKVELSENVLTKTFYAMTDLVNEIRGADATQT